MSAPNRSAASTERRDEAVPVDEYARGYAEGYGEGLKEALREILQHVSRGHTAQELRFLVESRLARVHDDVELKRKSVLSPPRRPAWGSILRPPASATANAAAPTTPIAAAGTSYLFREERPIRGAACAAASARGYPRVLAISLRPPPFAAPRGTELEFVPVQVGGDPDAATSPTKLSGRIRAAAESDGGALVYFDAFETMATEVGIDPMLKFVTWLVQLAGTTGSAVVVSVDPSTLDPRAMSLLQRSFPHVE